MNIKPQLQKDWQLLMQGMETVAKRFFKSKNVIIKDSHIIIHKDWDIASHFINNEYLEVSLSYRGENCLTVKHLISYTATTCAVLEFINNTIQK
jgi:hypothetical protein